MRKKHLANKPMSTAEETVRLGRECLAREIRGNGDSENAMRRLEAKTGIPFWTWWGLKYRPPKSVPPELMRRIEEYYLSCLESSVRRDLEKIKSQLARTGSEDEDAGLEHLKAEAEALLEKIRARMAL